MSENSNPQNIFQKEKEFYNQFAVHYDEKWLTLAEWQPLLKMEEDILNKYMIKRGQVLDIGCGTGRIIIPLAKRGFHCTGIDISEKMLNIAKEKAKKQKLEIDFRCQNAVEFPLNSHQYDYALLIFDMLSIIPGDESRIKVLKILYRSLRINGLLFISVWTYLKTLDVLLNEEGTLLPGRFWKKEDLILIVEKIGFELIDNISAQKPNYCREIEDYVLFNSFVFKKM